MPLILIWSYTVIHKLYHIQNYSKASVIHLKLNHRSLFLRRPQLSRFRCGDKSPYQNSGIPDFDKWHKNSLKISFCSSKFISLECFHLELQLLFVICLAVEEELRCRSIELQRLDSAPSPENAELTTPPSFFCFSNFLQQNMSFLKAFQ